MATFEKSKKNPLVSIDFPCPSVGDEIATFSYHSYSFIRKETEKEEKTKPCPTPGKRGGIGFSGGSVVD